MRKISCSRSAAWLLTFAASIAAGADEPLRIDLNTVAVGALSRTDLGIGMLEARTALSRHLLITAAPTILVGGQVETEYQFRTAATLLLHLGPIRIDDRNLWIFSDAGTTRYRNRLRLTAAAQAGGRTLRFQLLDEAFYERGGRGWFRNMVGAGVGIDFDRSLSADAYWMLLKEDHRPQTSMFLVMLTIPVGSLELRR